MKYHNVDLLIDRASQGYRVRVVSPMGTASNPFSLPYSDIEIENFILKVGPVRRAVRKPDSSQMKLVRDFGAHLFQATFEEAAYARLSSSLDQARLQEDGVRLRIFTQDVPELANLPWEFLFDANQDSFLALSASTPIVRFLQLSQPVFPLKAVRPLRILGIVSSPQGMGALDVAAEKRYLDQANRELRERRLTTDLEVDWLPQATLSKLQGALRRQSYHILHFVGHGAFDEAQGEGILIFEDEAGKSQPVPASLFGALLRDHATLRLAVLNACEGARSGREEPFSGVGPALVRAGLPAVVAMQFEITDKAAITFAREFYGAVADGLPVDGALAEARKAILSTGNEVEWATPVLFSRVDDGIVFQLPPRPAGAAETPDSLYQKVVELARKERWQEALAAWASLRQQTPDYPDKALVADLAAKQVRAQELYAEMSSLVAGRQWSKALEAWRAIMQIDPNRADPDKLVDKARSGLSKDQEVTARQQRLAELYDELSGLVAIARWQDADRVWKEIQRLDHTYPDQKGLAPKIAAGLAAGAKGKMVSAAPAPKARAGRGCLWVVLAFVALTAATVALWPVLSSIGGTATPATGSPTQRPIEAQPQPAAPVAAPIRNQPATIAPAGGSLRSRDLFLYDVATWAEHRVTVLGVSFTQRGVSSAETPGNGYDVSETRFQASLPGGVVSWSSAEGWRQGALYALGGEIPDGTETYAPPKLLLPAELYPGLTWSWQGNRAPYGDTHYEGTYVGREQVSVPAGVFDALHIRETGVDYFSLQPANYTRDAWLAPGVGLVKDVVYVGGQLYADSVLTGYGASP